MSADERNQQSVGTAGTKNMSDGEFWSFYSFGRETFLA